MGQILGILSPVIGILLGSYLVALYGGYYTPKKITDQQKEMIAKRKKLFVGLGIAIIVFNILNLGRILFM